jgi:hypothetical protein
MTDHSFSDDEIRFYLQFENPLEVVADAWRERNIDVDDVVFVMDFIMEPERQKSLLEAYPLSEENKRAVEPIVRTTDKYTKQSAKPKLPRAVYNAPELQSLNAQLNAAITEANNRNAARTPQTQQKSMNKEIE